MPKTGAGSQQTATTWPESEDPCPSGWRVPTRAELNELINKNATDTSGDGNNGSSSLGPSGYQNTTVSWENGTGSGLGLKVTTKAVSGVTADQVLYLPNAGSRNTSGSCFSIFIFLI